MLGQTLCACRIPASVAFLTLGLAVPAAESAPIDSVTGRERQAKTINELLLAFDFTFRGILTPAEYALYHEKTPEELKVESPVLYEKVSQNIQRWTDDWIRWAAQHLETVPPERLEKAEALVRTIDAPLRGYFESKRWPYRPLRVVFLPQRLLHNERARYRHLYGLFVPYYPEVFFSTIDPTSPMELVLIHESIHFQAGARQLSRSFTEGVTESAAELLARRWGLVTKGEVLQEGIYEEERAFIALLTEQIGQHTGATRDDALELLLGAYVSGDHAPLYGIFGTENWERVLELSRSDPWPKRAIRRTLATPAPPTEQR